jgi:hypothetical protein
VKLDVITEHRLRSLDLEPDGLGEMAPAARAQAIYAAFVARVPYENLSNNRSVREHPGDADQWPRATDRLLRENASFGFGGTSFSLSYALRDLLRGAGTAAHCTLGYNLVTEQAHAAVLVYVDEGPLLYDPALLMAGPVPVRPGGVLEDPLGRIRLEPRCGPTLTVTMKMHCGDDERGPTETLFAVPLGALQDRPIYSIIPVPAAPQNFRQAWIASFDRGRALPLRFARRVGDAIYRYGERPGSIEVLRPDCREEIELDGNPAPRLHDLFGIDAACIAEWFGRRKDD